MSDVTREELDRMQGVLGLDFPVEAIDRLIAAYDAEEK